MPPGKLAGGVASAKLVIPQVLVDEVRATDAQRVAHCLGTTREFQVTQAQGSARIHDSFLNGKGW
jgi:hypothetical protein